MVINCVAKIFFIYENCTHMRSNRLCNTCFDFIASMYNVTVTFKHSYEIIPFPFL